MATPYEILLQKDLERSRRNPLDEYSSGLVDLAKYQAQQRFLQDRFAQERQAAIEAARAHLAGQKEILTQTQRAAAEIQASREKSEAEIQKARDEAWFNRTEKSAEAAEKRAEIAAKSRERAAEIAAEAAVTKADRIAKEQRTKSLADYYAKELSIPKKKSESDEDYIARAQEELPVILGGQLSSLYRDQQEMRAKIAQKTSAALASYPERLAEAAWQDAKVLIPDSEQKKFLDKLKPLQRETQMALYGAKGKAIADAYQSSVTKLTPTIPKLDEKTQIELLDMQDDLKQTADELARKKADIRYAPAIPEFLRQIKAPSGSGAGIPDMSRFGGAAAAPPTGIASELLSLPATRPPLMMPGTSSQVTPPVRTGAGAAPASAAAAGAPAASVPPPPALTPDEIYGGGNYGWGPGQQRPLIGAITDRVGDAISGTGRFLADAPWKAIWGARDMAGSVVNQWTGLRPGFLSVPTPEMMQERYAMMNPPIDAEIANRELHPVPAPTAAEIMAARRTASPALPVTNAPPRMEIVAPPATLARLNAERNTEQRLLESYVRGRAPVFDPTKVNVETPAEIAAYRAARNTQPSFRAASPAEVAMSEAASASELRKRIARHPKASSFPVAPLKDKLSTMNLPELQALWRQLGPEDAPSQSEIRF